MSVRPLPSSLHEMIPFHQRSLPSRVLRGAAVGAVAGLILIGLGLAYGAVALLVRGRMEALTGHDLRMLAFYVGGLALGGAVFGAFRPLLRGKVGIYIGCMLVGVIVMLAIALGDKGSLRALDSQDWIALPAMGILFGIAGAFGFTRNTR